MKIRKLLLITSIFEIATGLILILATSTLIYLLFGIDVTGIITVLGRFVGIALLCFGLACWPGKDSAGKNLLSAVKGMLAYNFLASIFFFYIKFATELDGILLLPAAIVHGAIGIYYVYVLLKEGLN